MLLGGPVGGLQHTYPLPAGDLAVKRAGRRWQANQGAGLRAPMGRIPGRSADGTGQSLPAMAAPLALQ